MNKVHKLIFESGTKTYDIPEGYEVDNVVHADINSMIVILKKSLFYVPYNSKTIEDSSLLIGECCGKSV
jgi:hypothetical protein